MRQAATAARRINKHSGKKSICSNYFAHKFEFKNVAADGCATTAVRGKKPNNPGKNPSAQLFSQLI